MECTDQKNDNLSTSPQMKKTNESGRNNVLHDSMIELVIDVYTSRFDMILRKQSIFTILKYFSFD